jgi:hypothetical protein
MRKKGCKAAAVRNTASRRREEYTEHAVYNFGHVVVDAENWILSRMKNVDGQERENNGDTIRCGGEIRKIRLSMSREKLQQPQCTCEQR